MALAYLDINGLRKVKQKIDAADAKKLNKPINTGTQNQVLRSDGNGNSYWDDNVNTEEIAPAVESWLEDHLDPTSQYVIDDTLTIEGAAADAKATGDLVDELVESGETQPTDLHNKVWLRTGSNLDYVIPTYDEFENLTGSIANPYDETETYDIGDYCLYDSGLKKCIVAIAVPEEFDSTHWEDVQIIEEFENAASNLDGAIRYDTAQSLTEEQKSQARDNIGAATGAVRYDITQGLTAAQKQKARENIGAGTGREEGTVKYDEVQLLNDSEKYRARQNISAASQSDITNLGDPVLSVTSVTNGIRVTQSSGTRHDIEIAAGGHDFDTGYVDEDNLLHLTLDGEDIDDFTPFPLPAGGGGGGGGGAGTVTITRISAASMDCVYGGNLPIEFLFSATDSSGDPVGSGTGSFLVGGIVVAKNVEIRQGENSFNIGPYLSAGNNNIKLSVSVDTGGSKPQTATKTWTANAVNMAFTWNYNNEQINTEGFTDRWTVFGEIEKTTHTLLDNVAQATQSTTRSGYVQTMQIPVLSHGAHKIERWLTATIAGTPQSTPHQYHEAIFVQEGVTDPIIAISLKTAEPGKYDMKQYDTIAIPYVVYDPLHITTEIELFVDGTSIGTIPNVDRSQHYWYYTPTIYGAQLLTIQCGETTRTIGLNIEEVNIDCEEVGGYSFKFKASDMVSNNSVRSWSSNGINASFSENFDWVNGGLQTETNDNGTIQKYICIKAGTRMTINHKLFSHDPRTSGSNFKIIFQTKNCRNYDAQIMHCYANNVGIRMYAHKAYFNSSGTEVNVPYGEDAYMELEFDVYPAPRTPGDGNYRYMMAWLDGVITSNRVYGGNDNFVQPVASQENIVLGSDDCDLYVYLVKAYPMYITRDNHIDNFIMDAPNASEMVKRYDRNDILDVSGEINYEKLIEKNPQLRVWTYDIPYLTNTKDDKVKNCHFHQFWGDGTSYYQLSGTGTMRVQGTSSVEYIRGAANTDIEFTVLEDGDGNDLLANGTKDETYGNNVFVEDSENPGHAKVYTAAEAKEAAGIGPDDQLGSEWVVVERDNSRNPVSYIKALGYKINDDSCPITYSNTKVNFASCEQVNNMCNAKWYQMHNPYPSLTARDCMEFEMGVQFIKDSGTVPDASHFVLFGDDKYHMYSIANMGNSKKNVHIFHDISNPNECCIEINDNGADQMRMVNPKNLSYEDYFAAENWGGKVYYGMRYPDTKNPSQAIKNAWYRLVWWMVTSNPNDATGNRLSQVETYLPYTFKGHDRAGTQVLRGTTVTQYAGTYTHDTFERRMAKMLSECEDYMIMDSFIYHYLYIERHTMVDNVAKNTFWSCSEIGHTENGRVVERWDLSKAYDMDTSDGNNNQGQMVFDYGLEFNDVNPTDGKTVFNAAESVWFVFCGNLYEACKTMFTSQEAGGAWSATAYHEFLTSEQKKVPERCWVQCYWYDYLRTYEQGINDEWMTFLDGGQKTHQRDHYEYYEELYDASKYRGSASTSLNVNFRAYTPTSWVNTVSADNGAPIYATPSASASIVDTLPKGTSVTVIDKTNDEWRKIVIDESEYYVVKSNLSGIEPKNEITVTMYNKMYLSISIGTTDLSPIKIERGVPYVLDFSDHGKLNNTMMLINTAPMIQAIEGLEQLYPDTCVFSNAIRLRTLRIGSDEPGYENTNLKTLALSNNTMLEYLYAQNLPNANSVLDLSRCVSLIYVDAAGSSFTGYEFADGGVLETAICEKPTSLSLMNLSKLVDVDNEENVHFQINDYSRLSTLRHENTPGVDSMNIVDNAESLQIVRLVGIDWQIDDTDILDSLYLKQGLDESGSTTPTSVITGEVHIPSIKEGKKDAFNLVWPSLIILYDTLIPQFLASFYDYDGLTPILDYYGNPYTQYVDANDYPYDPIQAEEVSTPVRQMDEECSYIFSSWDSILSPMISDRKITASYASTPRMYTVEWYDGVPAGGGTLLKRTENVQYGACVRYSDNDSYPTYTALEQYQMYYVFTGWDKSTGYIKPDPNADLSTPNTIKVHALWQIASLPAVEDNIGLYNMNWAQRYGIAKNNSAASYWTPGDDDMEVTLGHGNDFEFANVESNVLISEPTYFGGNSPMIFNGENNLPSIQLFNGSIDRFTLAIDYEATSDSGVLISCFSDNGNQGFQIRRSSDYSNIVWGNQNQNICYKYQRGVVVIRYNRTKHPLVLYIAHDGNISEYRYPINPSSPDSNVTMAASARNVNTETDAPLTFGGIGFMNGSDVPSSRGHGWINWAKIWYDDIGDYNVAAIAAMPHLKTRFMFTGIQYRDGINSSNVVAADFFDEGCLPLQRGINSTNVNTGGWKETTLRSWLNGQYFAGLPIPLQFIIKEARVRSTEGDLSSNIVNSMDKVYISSYAELVNSVTDTAYLDECDDLYHRLPNLVYDAGRGQSSNSQTRIRWAGITLPSDANYIVGSSDPTIPGLSHTIHSGKTIWIKTDDYSRGYLYIDGNTASKHGFYAGRILQDSNQSNIIHSAGSDSDGGTNGLWILAGSMSTRSPNVSRAGAFWTINEYGNGSGLYAQYSYSIAPRFSF